MTKIHAVYKIIVDFPRNEIITLFNGGGKITIRTLTQHRLNRIKKLPRYYSPSGGYSKSGSAIR